jgi:spore coat protein U-like protein
MRILIALLISTTSAAQARAASCTIASVAGVVLGTYDVFDATPVDSTGTITYECTGVVGTDTVQITLSAGDAGTFATRAMSAGAETLSYNLYVDAARTTVWGDGTSGTATYGPILPAEGETPVTVFGRAPAGQDAAAGSYSDTIVVTVIF